MAELYILYDKTGRYSGQHYDDAPPSNFKDLGAAGYRKLTYDEINSTHYEFKKFIYNEPSLRRLQEIHFGVNTEVFEIQEGSQVFVFVKALHDDESQLASKDLIGKDVEITVNGKVVNIPFGDCVYLTPKTQGTYVFELTDKRFFSKKNRYVVTVIDAIPND